MGDSECAISFWRLFGLVCWGWRDGEGVEGLTALEPLLAAQEGKDLAWSYSLLCHADGK